MKQILRFSVSGLLGLVITAALFIGMLSLLNGQKSQIKTDGVNIKFSFVKDFKAPEVKPKPEKKLPEQQKITQAPTINRIATDPIDTPEIEVPNSGNTGEKFNIGPSIGITSNGFSGGDWAQGNPGDIKSAIPPMYPQKELAKKTEGWVQLLIEVNEFGNVSSAEVLQAKPARAFNAAAIKAVRKWKFHPKVVDGKAMPFQVTQTIEFKLDQ
ncbi:MAG: TonB family protein [Marinicella sp.]|nr:energy transducer TonB [Xanthomonadales bacterium]